METPDQEKGSSSMEVSAEEFIDTENLRRLLARGTGKGVRVAVLDTGVDVTHPALEGCVTKSYEVIRGDAGLVCHQVAGEDPVGHGTACAGIIHSWAPEAEIYSVRVVGKTATGTGEQFLYGLHWVLQNEEIHVVNLSIGTTQRRFLEALHELADHAYYGRTLIVAAAHNRRIPSFPAFFSSVVGVESGVLSDPLAFRFRLDTPAEVQANGIYVRAPSPRGKYQLWTGTSFACPHITALAARLLSEIPGLTPYEFKAFLKSLRENR